MNQRNADQGVDLQTLDDGQATWCHIGNVFTTIIEEQRFPGFQCLDEHVGRIIETDAQIQVFEDTGVPPGKTKTAVNEKQSIAIIVAQGDRTPRLNSAGCRDMDVQNGFEKGLFLEDVRSGQADFLNESGVAVSGLDLFQQVPGRIALLFEKSGQFFVFQIGVPYRTTARQAIPMASINPIQGHAGMNENNAMERPMSTPRRPMRPVRFQTAEACLSARRPGTGRRHPRDACTWDAPPGRADRSKVHRWLRIRPDGFRTENALPEPLAGRKPSLRCPALAGVMVVLDACPLGPFGVEPVDGFVHGLRVEMN